MKHGQPPAPKSFTNRLVHETSPYLRQHAQNPVDWYPWGPEALEASRNQDKPILLSIGYSACHWCHVMERESFENDEIARIMNHCFINIKVDREERPDLDSIYMSYVQMTTGSGGWPMTVFLTPDQVPFFGGTYFPPEDRYGRPGFPRICQAVYEAYQTRKSEIDASQQEVIRNLQSLNQIPPAEGQLDRNSLDLAFKTLSQRFDFNLGGFAGAPKFPSSMSIAFCLRYFQRTGLRSALDFVKVSLERMARGGIYDHIGGGFHRYSVDAQWLVPHFEKMLYDNALLSRLYLEAFQATRNPLYELVCQETLDYVSREMTHPEGGFYSTQDADSEGEEGKFFVWDTQEVENLLGRDARLFCRYFGLTGAGNFEGKNILNIPRDPSEIAAEEQLSAEELNAIVGKGRKTLFNEREKRIKPHRDEKILTSWNGLMLTSFARAAAVFGRRNYLEIAVQNAQFIERHLVDDSRIFRTWKDGQAKLKGYLEDYANYVEGLLALFEVTGSKHWLDSAKRFNAAMLEQFWDESTQSFFLTGSEHESLIARVRDYYDNATPAGSSVAILNLLKLSVLTGEGDFRHKAEQALAAMKTALERHPSGFGYLLEAADFLVGPVVEVVAVGIQHETTFNQLLRPVFRRFLPNKVVVMAGSELTLDSYKQLPLLEGKVLKHAPPAVYICENSMCHPPALDAEQLDRLLAQVSPGHG